MKLISTYFLLLAFCVIANAAESESVEDLNANFTVKITDKAAHKGAFLIPAEVLKKSQYFGAIVSKNYKESQEKVISLELDSLRVFERLLHFIYEDEIKFDEELDLLALLSMQEVLIITGLDDEILEILGDDKYLARFTENRLAELIKFIDSNDFRYKSEYMNSILVYIKTYKLLNDNCSLKLLKYLQDRPVLAAMVGELFAHVDVDNILKRREVARAQRANKKQIKEVARAQKANKEQIKFDKKAAEKVAKVERRLAKLSSNKLMGYFIYISFDYCIAAEVFMEIDIKFPGLFVIHRKYSNMREKNYYGLKIAK